MSALFSALERLRLTTKLMLGFGTGLLVAVVIGYNSLNTLTMMESEMESLYERDLLGISHIKEANINLIYMGRALRHAMIAQDDLTRDRARAQIETARTKLNDEMAEARKRIFRAEVIAKHEEFQRHFGKYNENVTHALAMLERERASSSEAAKFITSPEFMATVNAADEAMGAMTVFKETGSHQRMEAMKQVAADTRQQAYLLLALGIALAIGLGVVIGLSIKRPNERLQTSVEQLSQGNVDAAIPHTDYPNEIGIMARAIAVLQGIYRKAEDTRWIKAHAAEIGSALQGAEDMKALAQVAVSKIAPVIGAGHAGFYVAEGERHYQLLGSYGYRERKHLNNSLAVGEGLVGQAAMEKAPITLTAPKDYIRINSGLGEGPPACIAVLPVVRGERVLGVLEVASFQQFTERENTLLETLLPTLGTTMEILDRNQRTRELLAATQEQAERMEKQAAQLEEQQVEMEAQQAELLETENWFRSIIETAPDGMLVADAGGRILLANPQADALFGYEPGGLVGGQIDDLVPDRVRASHAAKRATFMAEDRRRVLGDNSRVTGKRKDGSEIAVEVTLAPLPPRGNRGKCVSVSIRSGGA